MLVLGFADYRSPAYALAQALTVQYAEVDIHHFPDGESRIKLPAELDNELVICRSLDQPNNKLIELLLVVRTARELGVRHITLVAPYLCYMRQDKAFNSGEIVSQRIIGKILAESFDKVVTVDPHLHRINHLEEVLPARSVKVLSAAFLIGKFIKTLQNYNDITLFGPDEESKQWIEKIAHYQGLNYIIAIKQRHNDRDVKITLPNYDYRNKHLIIIDDLASTGGTLAETAKALYDQGAAHIDVLVTHGLFISGSLNLLCQVGIKNIWSTDSVIHSSNVIALADLLAEGVLEK